MLLLLVDLSMALLLPPNALSPAATGARCAAGRASRGRAVRSRCERVRATRQPRLAPPACHARRAVLLGAALLAVPTAGLARTPGSVDVRESVEQIRDAAAALSKLRQECPPYP